MPHYLLPIALCRGTSTAAIQMVNTWTINPLYNIGISLTKKKSHQETCTLMFKIDWMTTTFSQPPSMVRRRRASIKLLVLFKPMMSNQLSLTRNKLNATSIGMPTSINNSTVMPTKLLKLKSTGKLREEMRVETPPASLLWWHPMKLNAISTDMLN